MNTVLMNTALMNRVAATILLLPRNVGVLVLRIYRALISPLYGDVCRFYPSCSAYALGAVQGHGLVIGSALAARRLARCHPWSEGGIDDVPVKRTQRYTVTSFGFVVLPKLGVDPAEQYHPAEQSHPVHSHGKG